MNFNDGGFSITVNDHPIYGYSRYISFYNEIVANSEDGAVFVEVGSFLGQSTAAMGQFILDSGKKISFNAVDLFEISDFSDEPHSKVIEAYGGNFFEAFKNNLKNSNTENAVTIHKSTSIEASKTFLDRSISFLMIDASHAYQDVIDDIEAWFPKVKLGGIVSGDDYDFEEVKQAVNDICGSAIQQYGNSTWWFRKQTETLEKQRER